MGHIIEKKKGINYTAISIILLLAVAASFTRSWILIDGCIHFIEINVFSMSDVFMTLEEAIYMFIPMHYPFIPFIILSTVTILKSKNRKRLVAFWGLVTVFILEFSNHLYGIYAGDFKISLIIYAIPSILLLLIVVIDFKPGPATALSLISLISFSLSLFIALGIFRVHVSNEYPMADITVSLQYSLFYAAMLVFCIGIYNEARMKKKQLTSLVRVNPGEK